MMKNKTALLFLISCGFLSACSHRPSNAISEAKMVDLMVDMELAEAYANTQMNSSSQQKIELGRRVLETHGVSEESLDTTLAWYGRNMDEYSKLFDKVDKELEKRKKHYTEIPGGTVKESDNLWLFGSHVILSHLSGSNSLSFSIPEPELEKGEILEFSFHLPNPTSMKGVLGVEYADGHGEAISMNFSSKPKVEISLQTDTAKSVARIFGYMSAKDTKVLPLYLDSLSLKTSPLDTLNYRSKKRAQKMFGSFKLD